MLDDSGRDITYRGGPSQNVTRFILANTETVNGKHYYQNPTYSGNWMPLDANGYKILNAWIQAGKEADANKPK